MPEAIPTQTPVKDALNDEYLGLPFLKGSGGRLRIGPTPAAAEKDVAASWLGWSGDFGSWSGTTVNTGLNGISRLVVGPHSQNVLGPGQIVGLQPQGSDLNDYPYICLQTGAGPTRLVRTDWRCMALGAGLADARPHQFFLDDAFYGVSVNGIAQLIQDAARRIEQVLNDIAVKVVAQAAQPRGIVELRGPVVAEAPAPAVVSHEALAHQLRTLSGLPASDLAAMLGVTRESFQRWLSGGPIKPTNENHLRYLCGLMLEAKRKLGVEGLASWLRTPVELDKSDRTPLDLLKAGLFGPVHAAIVKLPDPRPIVDSRVVGLHKLIEPEEDWVSS